MIIANRYNAKVSSFEKWIVTKMRIFVVEILFYFNYVKIHRSKFVRNVLFTHACYDSIMPMNKGTNLTALFYTWLHAFSWNLDYYNDVWKDGTKKLVILNRVTWPVAMPKVAMQ